MFGVEYGGYIFASYAATFGIIAALLIWTLLDGRAQTKELARLEARGVRRRSQTAEKTGA